MEAVPLIPSAKVLPNLDAVPLLKELFQDEFQAVVPSQKLSQNILTSLQYQRKREENPDTYRSVKLVESLTDKKENVSEFIENTLEAYATHKTNLQDLKKAEEHLFETHADFLKRNITILKNRSLADLLSLKRQPLFKALKANYVKKYKLLQGEASLPLKYELNSDFRVQNFQKWKKQLENLDQNTLIEKYFNRKATFLTRSKKHPKNYALPKEKKIRKPCGKKKVKEKPAEILRPEPKMIFFTDYKLGDVYAAEIKVKNVHLKGVRFQLKTMCPDGPFRVFLNSNQNTTLSPGLSFQLIVEFTPKSLDNAAEDIVIVTEDGSKLLIPLIAYLEPPVLKTHKDIDEFTKITLERITSSYIECGTCFTGDTKVTKLKFRGFRGSGEFFVMSSENWSRSHINMVTMDNQLEIPPFRVYPVFFKVKKNEVIDLFVEFSPKISGMHVENIVIACDNGQVRSLDLLGDAVGWHSYYFSFQDFLIKNLPADKDDDLKVKHYLDFEDTTPNGKVEKKFCVSNNSNMTFEFQWKIREANILSSHGKFLKLSKGEVKIDPESGTIEPKSVCEFLVSITLNNAELGNYRMVLSLYVLNLPYQCIEEDNTIIQPTGLVRNLYSQSLYGEEECSALSPDLGSLQGTYESLQESIKSYAEYQNKVQAAPKHDFCKTTCIPNPGLCAKPLKKSKTLFNIGDDESLICACRIKPVEQESMPESCNSYIKEEKGNEMSPERNEIIWDFVDILVDEIELWVEVVPPRVTLEPSVIEINNPINVNDEHVLKKVRVVNHNQCAVTCSWLLPSENSSTEKDFLINCNQSNPASMALLFDKKAGNKNQKNFNDCLNSFYHLEQSAGNKSNQNNEKMKNFDESPVTRKYEEISDLCKIKINPSKTFTVLGLSDFVCDIEISPCQPGRIKKIVGLNVNDGDLNLNLCILGTATTKSFEISPNIVDFGVLKQGTRYIKDFAIINESSSPLFWKINEFKFDFKEQQFFSDLGIKKPESVKHKNGVVVKKGNSATVSYNLDARVPGIKCSLLEIEEHIAKQLTSWKQYILVLGSVKIPKLSLSSPRFANAILSPPGMMHVGQKISTKVTLCNNGSVETFFTWGNSFGCHSRKIKVIITPKTCRIEKKKKLTINVDLIALEEGIISHCYIPCFFCRSVEPLILSVVAIAENIKVTFEIIDYPMQLHADSRTFLKSPFYHTVLRVPWPSKTYDPTLSLNYINERDINNMQCRCLEIEEEAVRAFNDPKKNTVHELEVLEKSAHTIQNFEVSDESGQKSKSSLLRKKTILTDEQIKLSTSNRSGSCGVDNKKSEENSMVVYSSVGSSSEYLQIEKCQLEFLNVPYQTPILRQFVIRNETPIKTNFQILASAYGVSKDLPDRRLEMIKNRVFGCTKINEFQNKLLKNQPLVIVVEPSRGKLKPYDAVCINVHCFANTWGEYRDSLVCQIEGIEPYHLKMLIQIVGHPIYFPMFETQSSQKPVLRFQPLNCADKAVTKQIKVVNRSSIPVDITWMVFLTKPVIKYEREDSYTLRVDSNANFESNHSGEESTQSSKNYIPKNTSDSVLTLSNAFDGKDFSQNSETCKSLLKDESSSSSSSTIRGKKEKKENGEIDKKFSTFLSEDTVSDMQQLMFTGRPDTRIFQVTPKEMFFEPFEEKNINVTFDPNSFKLETYPQEFSGVLASCVKLKPEDEKRPGFYYRPCGISFVSELIEFSGLVELPFVTFDILKGDTKFIVDSNAVIKSESKNLTISRIFLIKNMNQKSVSLRIETSPGIIFRVKKVNTLDKLYPEYDPDIHNVKVEPGYFLEMELECSVSYKDVMYAFEQLKLSRKREQCSITADETKANINKFEQAYLDEKQTETEPWKQGSSDSFKKKTGVDSSNLSHKDSFEINLNRLSSKSENSLCYDYMGRRAYYTEAEGEYLDLPKPEEIPWKPKPPRHIMVIEEEINFIQYGLVTQTLIAELDISFPAIKISPKCVNFGNVYLGETAVRYCSVINLTGFPNEFRVKAISNAAEFVVSPLTGKLPSTDYNSEIGKTLTLKFKPSQPGYFKEVYHVYCNLDYEFDFYELFVSGFGTWNEKYKSIKFETFTKVDNFCSNILK